MQTKFLLNKFFKKYKTEILYLFFGVLTTLINTIVFLILYNSIGLSNVFSNIIAWIAAVNFAFITNRFFVFVQNGNIKYLMFKQFILFIFSRVNSGILDITIMFLSVDILNFNEIIMKIGSNIIVILLNYYLSKNYIFNTN